MKFSRVRFASPTGMELLWRNSSQSVFQLDSASGWDLTADTNGVIGIHESRPLSLFVPWTQVAHCDILADAKPAKKAS